ncbi:hypothetical protein HID58_068333 [Brassica napus]|uniref:Uncharacterized protein n=1 Tax=Brassica napus TaxID=3708 RepID=A0ABQ7ZL15_BRANA|nr:hypothetical protein HID58_068333 [Brassica napus]
MDAFERKNRSHGVNATSEEEEFKEPVENIGWKLDRQAAAKTSDLAGPGACLAQGFIDECATGTLRAKQKVSIRCIMCGDMRLVAKVVVVGSGVVAKCVFGRCVDGGLRGCTTSSGQTSCEVVRNQG